MEADFQLQDEKNSSFPHLLYSLLNKAPLNDILRWNSDTSFVIVNLKKLSEEVSACTHKIVRIEVSVGQTPVPFCAGKSVYFVTYVLQEFF